MDVLFDHLLGEVSRLVEYPDWLPKQKCQLSFYSQTLESFSKAFQSFTTTDDNHTFELLIDPTLHVLVTRILEYNYARTSVDISNVTDPPELTDVGDRLAFEVAEIYKAYMKYIGKKEECDSNEFVSMFQFNINEFREGEIFVGFQAEASNLLQQLASITKKHVQVISIVGMAGLGKTTLARRLYNDPYVVSYFYVRAWVTCSQVYNKRDLLLSILSSVGEITDDIHSKNDIMLAQMLYRALKDCRYLILIDDIWSREAWDDFKSCFPDDNNGSRILLTTRLKDVALHAQSDRNPLCLRFLTEEESFELFRKKAFKAGNFFGNLSLIGESIARNCRGLPLAIVVIAGLLKNNFEDPWGPHIARRTSPYFETDEKQYMDTLALSYNHLPQHLRPCFLSFGAFPEDHDIPVDKLIWLWIAEGFIPQEGSRMSSEHVAEDYLMDLIKRSLVVVSKRRSNGSIKTCRIHDLLRDLCLRKATEENFPPNIYKFNKHFYMCSKTLLNTSSVSHIMLCYTIPTYPSNCSCHSFGMTHTFYEDVSIGWNFTELCTALDISSIELFLFPSVLLQLVHLRYLELRFRSGNPPESISRLRKLQTLIMSSLKNMVIPINMWKMINLRHLSIKSGENLLNFSDVEGPGLLENLQTMSLVNPTWPCQNILARTCNLQKLGLCGPMTTEGGDFHCPDLGLLIHLETLNLINTNPLLKEARVFENIPNLEVLKLKLHAFVGEDWETSPEAFPRLKFLKLDELNIVTWTASSDHFPLLQRLQVYRCPDLMEIPEDFGNICTLEWIELSGCSDAVANSARDIQEEQESYGNDWLKILLKPGLIPS